MGWGSSEKTLNMLREPAGGLSSHVDMKLTSRLHHKSSIPNRTHISVPPKHKRQWIKDWGN